MNYPLATLVSALALTAFLAPQPAYPVQEEPKKPATEAKKPQEEKQEEAEKGAEGEKSAEDGEEKKEEKPKEPKFVKMTKDKKLIPGMFDFYVDEKKGAVSMTIKPEQVGKEFIYHSHLEDGIVEAGFFRGQYRGEKVFEIRREYDKIYFVEKNPFFYFDPDNAISKAASANISDGVTAVAKIEAEDEETGAILIKASGLFLSETFEQIKPSRRPGPPDFTRFSVGKLSKAKSRIVDIKSYDTNASVLADFVYTNGNPINQGGFDVVDARNVTVKVMHTFIEMPKEDYTPRFDDQRVGYFLTYQNDQTDLSDTPYRDMINRWKLVKKDPTAELSEPVEPITWWIENTTPEDLRPTIKAAVEAWNIAFEAAGFKNAVVVNIQPDDADWDAGDVTKNVLRWTSSPNPPFGGYGPSFANPRTGQLLGADIMLEYTFLANRIRQGTAFSTALLDNVDPVAQMGAMPVPVPAADKAAEVFGEPYAGMSAGARLKAIAHDHRYCSLANHMQFNNMVGQTLQTAYKIGTEETEELIKESIYYLMLHEVGHTLGLNHNMKATQSRSYDEAHDIDAQDNGLVGSVMDYPAINFAPRDKEQAHYYSIRPGDYDIWAIQFAYDPDLDDPAKRADHLAKSLDPALAFGNDADDMRAPGFGIDPRVNIGDFSSDAVQYSIDRLELTRDAMGELVDNFVNEGESYQDLRIGYLVLTGDMASQARTISRYIGGVYMDRMVAGQTTPDGRTLDPYRPVSKARQKQAMQALREFLFSPDAFAAEPELLRKLSIQRRGFFQFGGELPALHQRSLLIKGAALQHLLHPSTLIRMQDAGTFGNDYSAYEMMTDLTSALFDDDARGAVNTYRQDTQVLYVKSLINMLANPFYSPVSQSAALSSLRSIRSAADRGRARGDGATRAHRDHLVLLIDKALETYTG